MSEQMGIDWVMENLPHRAPFLLVDRVESLVLNESIVAYKNISINEPQFVGHFPFKPVMPGVMMIEALAQASGILMMRTLDVLPTEENLFVLAGVDNARFKRIVQPGDVLKLEVKLLKVKRHIWVFEGRASVDGELACSAELMCAQKDIEP